MSASKIQAKIAKFCRMNGYYYNKIITASRSGVPDCFVIIDGVTYFFEIKYGRDKLSKLQEVTIDKLNVDKSIAYVVKSYEEFIDAVTAITGTKVK